LTGGTVTSATINIGAQGASVTADSLGMPITTMVNTLASVGLKGLYEQLLSGGDDIMGSVVTTFGDVLNGYAGNDTIRGLAGNDTIFGGAGDDVIFGPENLSGITKSYLRGDDGADRIYGAGGFDDINGNKGDDICLGGPGADWVVGGQGADLLYGDGSSPYTAAPFAGDDIVYGNMGADTCYGGEGNDIVRGGQDDDRLFGDAGNDWLSGDRGSDVITGGAGADTFYSFAGAGLDVITDFSRAQGDRVQLAPGTTYALRQSGADAVVDLGNGDMVILQGVQASSLTGDWLFFA
jgi:serralysin